MDFLTSFSARAIKIEKSKKLARIYATQAVDYAGFVGPQGVNPKYDDRFRQLLSEAEKHAKVADDLEKNIIIRFPPLAIPIKLNGRYNFTSMMSVGIRTIIVFLAFVLSKFFKHI